MKVLAFAVVMFTLVSCREEFSSEAEDLQGPYCNVDDPVNDLAWLHQRMEEFTQANNEGIDMLVYTVTYNGQPAFEIGVCCPACNTLPPEIFNCIGDSLGRINMGIEADELSDRLLLWRTNNVCNPG